MRLKIIAGNVIVVLLVGLASYGIVHRQIKQRLGDQVDGRITNEVEILSRSWRLSGKEFAAQVTEKAGAGGVRQALLTAVGEQYRRARAFDAAQEVSSWFQNPARGRDKRPDIVAVVDETGTVLARDTDPNRMFGKSLAAEVPALANMLQDGVPVHEVWSRDGKLLHVAMAPIRSDSGGIVGALLVGYDLSNGFAKKEAGVLGRDVMFITTNSIYSTSTDIGVKTALQAQLYGSGGLAGLTAAALKSGVSAPWSIQVGGVEYLGVVSALPDVAPGNGFVVLANKSQATALASVANSILLLMLVGLIGVIAYGAIVANTVIVPIERIEEDVLAVINGRTDRRVEVDSREFGGLAYRINQLLNLFMGVAEEDDDGRAVTSAGAWEAVPMTAGLDESSGVGSIDAEALADEPAHEYYARLYREYVSAKQAAGEDVSNIAQDRFVERIKGNEQHLLAKHKSRMVRFRVEVESGQVNLKPVIIK